MRKSTRNTRQSNDLNNPQVPPKKASGAANASAGRTAGPARNSTGSKPPAKPARPSAGKASGGVKKGSGASRGAAAAVAASAGPGSAGGAIAGMSGAAVRPPSATAAAAAPMKRAFTVPTAKKAPAGSGNAPAGAPMQGTTRELLAAAAGAERVDGPGEDVPTSRSALAVAASNVLNKGEPWQLQAGLVP